MNYTLTILFVIFVSIGGTAEAKELKQKKSFKIPEGTAFVTTYDINNDKSRDFIVQEPEKITIYSGKDYKVLFTIPLDSKKDESFFLGNAANGRFSREDLIRDLDGNGIKDIPIRGLDLDGSEYIKLVDPKTQEVFLETRYKPTSDNIFIYDIDGNDSLDVVIERLDSILIFSSRVIVPVSVDITTIQKYFATVETYPNPTQTRSTIVWHRIGNTKASGAVAVIMDAQGREVRRMYAESTTDKTQFEWDGKATDNSMVPSGCYFVKVSSNETVSDGRIVVVR